MAKLGQQRRRTCFAQITFVFKALNAIKSKDLFTSRWRILNSLNCGKNRSTIFENLFHFVSLFGMLNRIDLRQRQLCVIKSFFRLFQILDGHVEVA